MQDSRCQGTDILLTRHLEPDGGKGSVLTHHAWHLCWEVATGCCEHLTYICWPRGSFLLPTARETQTQTLTKLWLVSESRRSDSFIQLLIKWNESKEYFQYLGLCCSSLKMCTVSVLLEAQRNWASGLKERELMLTYLWWHRHTQKSKMWRKADSHIPQFTQTPPTLIFSFYMIKVSLRFTVSFESSSLYLFIPRRNSNKRSPSGMEKTRITVP